MMAPLPTILEQLTEAQAATLNAFDSLVEVQDAFNAVEVDHEIFGAFRRVRHLMTKDITETLRMFNHMDSLVQRYIDITRDAITRVDEHGSQ